MPTIGETLNRLLPFGTNPGRRSLRICPAWPPDLFAVTATLLESSSLYADLACTAGWDADVYLFNNAYLREVARAAAEWARTGNVPPSVGNLWDQLRRFGHNEVTIESLPVIIRLMAIADAASVEVGFVSSKRNAPFPTVVLNDLMEIASFRRPRHLPYAPSSLCRMIPNDLLCVQPKTNVPLVGCTLRSLSHNLALLPPVGVVETNWFFMHPAERKDDPLNLLLIPYPFMISANYFVPVDDCVDKDNCYFSARVGSLDAKGAPIPNSEITKMICSLIESARREVKEVHGVVFPETALLESDALQIAAAVADKNPELELFIAGVLLPELPKRMARNCAYTARLHRSKVFAHWMQSKHHRWRLEESQIERYHLGDSLNPEKNWWEKIDVCDRTCFFTVVRWGASLAVLICEDLARFDPVLPAINAVGPTLVIALLMDGPQLERRWPGRYATVLADDPGSSVLTLTSLGMVRRSSMPGDEGTNYNIALWKEAGGSARELKLSKDHQGLLLSLITSYEKQTTMDRRTDRGATARLRLFGARQVAFATGHAPNWLH
jgi:hypothetical protein